MSNTHTVRGETCHGEIRREDVREHLIRERVPRSHPFLERSVSNDAAGEIQQRRRIGLEKKPQVHKSLKRGKLKFLRKRPVANRRAEIHELTVSGPRVLRRD